MATIGNGVILNQRFDAYLTARIPKMPDASRHRSLRPHWPTPLAQVHDAVAQSIARVDVV